MQSIEYFGHPNIAQTFFARCGGQWVSISGVTIRLWRGDTSQMCPAPDGNAAIIRATRPALDREIAELCGQQQ